MPLAPISIQPENAITVYRGQNKTLGVTVVNDHNIAVDLTGGRILFTVKESVDSTNPLIQKSSDDITQAALVSPREGRAHIYLSPTDTKNMAIKQYVFDVWFITADNKRYPVVLPSVFDLKPSVTVLA